VPNALRSVSVPRLFGGEAPGALRSSRSPAFGAKGSEFFGAPRSEALESRHRRLFGTGGASSFRGHGVVGCMGARGFKGSSESAVPKALSGRHSRGSKSEFWEGSKARAGRRSRRRERQLPGGQSAEGGSSPPSVALARSKTGTRNVRSVCLWGTGGSGREEAWRSRETDEGSGRW